MKTQFKNLKAHLSFSLIAVAMIAPACAQMDTAASAPTPHKNGKQTSDMKEEADKSNEKSGMKSSLTNSDKQFVMKAAMGGMLEVKVGKLAQEKGSSSEVKEYGAMMVKDHTKANAELMTLASSKGLTIPSALDAKHENKYEGMTKLSGDDFDKTYLKDMIADHEQTVSLFEAEAKKGDDADLKSFATKTLPTHLAHLEHVRGLKAK